MRLSWFSHAPRRRRAAGARRRSTAPLVVRRLERRRVLDASIQTVPAATPPDGPLVVDEGTSVSASATSTGPSPYLFDWSLTEGMTTLQTGTNPTFNFVTVDDANLTVHLELKDAAGELSTDTLEVIVNNVAPTVELGSLDPINENSVTTLQGSYTDPGLLDSQTLVVDWDDPNNGVDSTFEIPALRNAAGMATLTEGDTFSSLTDDAELTITSIDAMTGKVGFSVQHRYLDDGLAPGNNTASDVSNIGVTVTDDDMESGNDSTSLTVLNVAPTVALNDVSDINENGTATLTGSYTDIGLLDRHTMTVDWDDPNDTVNSTFEVPSLKNIAGMLTLNEGDTFNSSTDSAILTIISIDEMTGQVGFSVQHRYLDDGLAPGNDTAQDTSTIRVTVADDDTHSGDDTSDLLVKNVAPTVVLGTVTDIDENGTATLTGNFTDVGQLDRHSITVDWDDPNDTVNSAFEIPSLKNIAGMLTLNEGDTFNSSTDSAILTIISIDEMTGQVGFSVQHQYLDDGLAPGNDTAQDTSTIRVTVADDDTHSGDDTSDLLVKNVAPTVVLGTVTDIDENGTATLTGSYTDIGLLDRHTMTVDWDDPNDGVDSTFEIPSLKNAAGMLTLNEGDTFNSTTDDAVLTIVSIDEMTGQVGFSVQHQYLDDGLAPGNDTAQDTSTIRVTVADDDTHSGDDTSDVLVKNVAPTVALSAVPMIDENGTATLTGSYTDIGLLDRHTMTVDWDDPNDGVDSTFEIPSLKNAAGMLTLNEGDTFNSTTDDAVLTIVSIDEMTGQVGFSVQHQYLDDGLAPGNNTAQDTSTIRVTVADDDTHSGDDTSDVLVKNVAPTVALSAVPMIDENGTATLTGSYTDIGLLDRHTMTVDWDDPNDGVDSTFEIPSLKNAAGMLTLNAGDTFNSTTDDAVLTIVSIDEMTGQVGFSVQHQYLDDGLAPGNNTAQDTSTIRVTVADDDTHSGDDTSDVLVKNVAPTVALSAVPMIDENGTATLTGSYTDIGLLDRHTMTVDWDDPNDGVDSTFEIPSLKNAAGMLTLNAGDTFNSTTDDAVLTIVSIDEMTGQVGFSVQHQYLDDGLAPGNDTAQDTSTIRVTVADDDTHSGDDTSDVLVKNVAPTVALSAVPMIDENGKATLTGSYTDIGLLDRHTMTVDWDDPNDGVDSTFEIPSLKNAAGMLTLNAGDTFNSTTDDAVLTIVSIDEMTGQVGFSVQHQYLDDGLAPGNNTAQDTSTIRVTVADDDTHSGDDTSDVLVKNVAPTVALSAVPMIDENGTATLTGSYTDIGLLDRHTMTVDWDDPNDGVDSTFEIPSLKNAAGMLTLNAGDTFNSTTDDAVLTIVSIDEMTGQVGFSVQHQYLDDGLAPGNDTAQDTSTIRVTVADDDTHSGDDTSDLLVKNVAPTVVLGTVTDIDENGTATLTGNFTDVGQLDRHSITVDWDDPNDTVNSAFEIPALKNAAGMLTLNEGDTFNSTTDDAVLTIVSIDEMTGQVGFSVQHQYLDDGLAPGNDTAQDTSTIRVTVADDDTHSGDDTSDLLVKNLVPELTLVVNQSRNEGQLLNLSGTDGAFNLGSFTDVGTLDLHKAQIDWGDGHVEVGTVIQSAGSGMIVGSHTYADDGVYTVIVRLADDDMSSFLVPGNFNTGSNGVDYVQATFTVAVSNVLPSLTDVGPTNVVNEGQAFVISSLTGSTLPNLGIGLTDPGFDNPLNPTTPSLGDPFQETFTSSTINWGDGTAETPVSVVMRTSGSPGVPTTALFQHVDHTYADNGVYTVRVRVADDNMSGNFATGTNGVDYIDLTFTITVLNVNPEFAGFTSSTTTINESGSVNFNIDFSDDGFDNPLNTQDPSNGSEVAESFQYDINWGDGRQTLNAVAVADANGSPGVASTGTFGGSHIYADDGTYTVTVVIHDDDGGIDTHVFTVVVQNVNPSFVPNSDGDSFEGDQITSTGFTKIRVGFSDPGFDNTANPNPDAPPSITDTLHESFTHVFDWGDGTVDAFHTYVDAGVYTVSVTITGPGGTQSFSFTGFDSALQPVLTLVSDQTLNDASVTAQLYTFVVDWGDGAVQTIPLMLRNPGTPLFNNGLTTVITAGRASGNEGILTSGSFEMQHRYTGPPNPNNPTADIRITTTIVDDNNGSVSGFIEVPNPGISANIVAVDTTPLVPRLEFVPIRGTEIFLGQLTSSVQGLQTQDIRVARSDQNLTSDVYLELRIVHPDGSESEGYRLPDDALQNLRAIIATLPDNHYKIYLVRTENNSRRLVMEVVVRRGRVVDPSDDSEGTRDRPPTSKGTENPDAMPLEQNPLLERVPNQAPNDGLVPPPTDTDSAPPTQADDQVPSSTQSPAASRRYSSAVRRSIPLAAVGLAAAGGNWSKRVDEALATANRAAWQRLRRAGRLGGNIRAPRP